MSNNEEKGANTNETTTKKCVLVTQPTSLRLKYFFGPFIFTIVNFKIRLAITTVLHTAWAHDCHHTSSLISLK